MRTFSARQNSLIGEAVCEKRFDCRWTAKSRAFQLWALRRLEGEQTGRCAWLGTLSDRNELFFSSLRWPGPYPELSSAFMQSPPSDARLLGLDRRRGGPGRGNQSAFPMVRLRKAPYITHTRKAFSFQGDPPGGALALRSVVKIPLGFSSRFE